MNNNNDVRITYESIASKPSQKNPYSQVLHSAQQVLAFGEAFSGDDSPQLRAILASNATAAFQTLVVADLATLRDVLAHEIWKRSSLSEGGATIYLSWDLNEDFWLQN